MTISKRKRVQTQTSGPSMTQQQFKSQCDINHIMKKFEQTGILPQGSRQGSSGDFSNIHNFQTNLNMVIQAQNAFDSLPAELRKRFGNDPSLLLEFVHNDSNYDEAVKLGLVPKKPDPIVAAPNDDKTTITQATPPQA